MIVLALIGYWLVKPILTGTIDAGYGAPCPECAVDQYIFYGPHNPRGDDVLFRRTLCADRRDDIATEANAFADAYRGELQKWSLLLRLEPGMADAVGNGEHARVIAMIQHFHETAAGKMASRSQHPWTFEVVNEDGWRVCDVTHPNLCKHLVKCDGPANAELPNLL